MTAPYLHPTLLPTSTASMTSCKSSSPLLLGEARDGEEEPNGIRMESAKKDAQGVLQDRLEMQRCIGFGGAALGCPSLMPSSQPGHGSWELCLSSAVHLTGGMFSKRCRCKVSSLGQKGGERSGNECGACLLDSFSACHSSQEEYCLFVCICILLYI